MTVENSSDRAMWEAFTADPRFSEVRSIRSRYSDPMRELRSEFKNFRDGKHELTPVTVQLLRSKLLRMLQLQYAMTQACDVITPEFEIAKTRILVDFETTIDSTYMAKVNSWIQVIESSTPATPSA
jgi:hypothetical protein